MKLLRSSKYILTCNYLIMRESKFFRRKNGGENLSQGAVDSSSCSRIEPSGDSKTLMSTWAMKKLTNRVYAATQTE